LKKDEKKIDYNSSSHSISQINKQLQSHEQLVKNQYASNNSGGASNPIYINVDSEYSMNSDPRFCIKSNKNIVGGGKNPLDLLNVEVSLNEGDQSYQNNPVSCSNDKSKHSHLGANIHSRDFENDSNLNNISSDKKLVPDVSLPNL
jgi:hypothetical protein